MDLIERYYRGVTARLRDEVDLMNALYQHPGTKGESNEIALRDLLARFLPRQYEVGTGFVVDRNNALSKQCDLIIYDTFYDPIFLLISYHALLSNRYGSSGNRDQDNP